MLTVKAHDQAFIRQANLHSVLKILRKEQPVSRKDLIHISGMSPTSITRIVSTLLELSLVEEGEFTGEAGSRGRKAILLHTNPDGLYTLGFFLGRTGVQMTVQNFDNELLLEQKEALPRAYRSAEELAAIAHGMYERIPAGIIRNPSLVRGIGITLSGTVNQMEGVVDQSIHMHWQGVDVRGAFERAFSMPVWVENDVKAALIGEKDRLGVPRQTDAAYLYLGEYGLSTALTSHGELVRGKHNAAGEVAHIVLSPSDLPCDCGKYGCAQLHLVETYLVQRASKIDPAIRSMEGIVAACEQHVTWAEVMVSDFRRHLLLLVALLDSFFDPACIIVSGEVVRKLNGLLGSIDTDDHIILAGDYEGAALRGVSIIAMQQTLIRRLSEYDEPV